MRKHAEVEDEGMLRVTRTGVAALPYSRRVVAEEGVPVPNRQNVTGREMRQGIARVAA
ncbi:hypothetical protein HF285_04725 [Acidithiobacillus ferrooxidans F221]|uniref:hypothetical protein n=1 Tax=Acidithiobacillus ferrooxidans TaxID=920 RepID=UPI001C069893|nr:hypothetical protein [Acidithiobacillus ferrooxidans]MBU2807586.1 hypothetical protein [Acidithiobacillus ferrooxidans F221]